MTLTAAPTTSDDRILARFSVNYPGFSLNVDLNLPGRGITILFGHSGSGKTTCLRCIAGLERASEGYLQINGELWEDSSKGIFVPTHKRALGYVFQEASLFPHLSVRKNLEYGLRRVPAEQHRVSWDKILDLLGIGHLLERMPDRLSGGERQRVGIARALLTSPTLLLMDEPLAALDLQRKNEILPYLERLHDELDIPILYISHSPEEVARLADYVVLLNQGTVAAEGGVQETMARLDLPTAFSGEASVVIAARVARHDDTYHLTTLTFPGGEVLVSQRLAPVGQPVRVQVYARDVSLAAEKPLHTSISNLVQARVTEVVDADTPSHVLVRLEAETTPLLARITRRSRDQLDIKPGMQFWAQIKSVALLG